MWDYQPGEIDECVKYLKQAVMNGKHDALKLIAYESFGCNDIVIGEEKKPWKYTGAKNHDTYREALPEYKKSSAVMAMYEWLKGLDYEMDDEEIQYIEGTHPVFRKEGAA